MSESKRKVKVVTLKDEKEWEEKYTEFAETPIIDAGDFVGFKRRHEGGRIFIDPTTGEPILPEFRLVKCRCGRKFKAWRGSENPPVWIGRCPRCRGLHYVGDVDAVGKADRRQTKEWLRKAKQMKKKGGG